jgi:hypothetical protein
MLIRLTEDSGEAVWLNPLYVRLVKAKGGKKPRTEVFYHLDPTRANDRFLSVTEPADEVARAVSDGLALLVPGLGITGLNMVSGSSPGGEHAAGDTSASAGGIS